MGYCVRRVRLADNCSQHCAVWLCSKTKLRKVANEARHLAVRLLYHSILCVKKRQLLQFDGKFFVVFSGSNPVFTGMTPGLICGG